MLWILVVKSASSNVKGGRMLGLRLASMDLPVPEARSAEYCGHRHLDGTAGELLPLHIGVITLGV
jgi:hypothetical protein